MHVGVGEVEHPQDVRKELAVHQAVKGTADVRSPLGEEFGGASPFVEVEFPGHGERAVVSFLEGQPVRIHPPEIAILGVDPRGETLRLEIGLRPRLLLIGGREQDQAMNRFGAPAVGDEPPGQPVEKLGMAWRLGAEAEVAGSADQARSEVVHPDPVDPNPRRQGIRWVNDRPGHVDPAASVFERLAVGAGNHLEKPPGNLVPLVRRAASLEDPGLSQLGAVDHRDRVWRSLGRLDQPAVNLPLQLPDFLDILGVEVELVRDDRLVGDRARTAVGVKHLSKRLGVGVVETLGKGCLLRFGRLDRLLPEPVNLVEEFLVTLGDLDDRRRRLGERLGNAAVDDLFGTQVPIRRGYRTRATLRVGVLTPRAENRVVFLRDFGEIPLPAAHRGGRQVVGSEDDVEAFLWHLRHVELNEQIVGDP